MHDKTEGLFLYHCCLLAVFDTSYQYFHRTCSILLSLHPIPVTQQAGWETPPLKHKREKGSKGGILHTPLAPSFSKSYCNTSTVASASCSPSLKRKKQALPLPVSVKEINNLKAQEKQDAPSLGALCSQSYRKGTIASTRQLLLLPEPGSLLPAPHKRHISLRHGCGRFQVPMQASTAIQSRNSSFLYCTSLLLPEPLPCVAVSVFLFC